MTTTTTLTRLTEPEVGTINGHLKRAISALDACGQRDLSEQVYEIFKEVAQRCYGQSVQTPEVRPVNRPLGDNQRSVLAALRRHGNYYRGGGWVWTGHLGTVRILDTLVKRGLVEVHEKTIDPLGVRKPYVTQEWVLTEAGKAVQL